MRILLLISAVFILTGCMQVNQPAKTDLCAKIWRYDLECAINYTLQGYEIEKIGDLARTLKGDDCSETSWNVLAWVDGNVKYDMLKASSPPPVIQIVGDEVTVVSGFERTYQTPAETLTMRKGICGDYAILTAALLLAANCSPVYVFNISFGVNNPNHIAAGIELNGSFYILDQHLPPLDAGSYYTKWLKDGKQITAVTVYKVDKGITAVNKVSGEFLKKFDYKIKQEDAEFLERKVGWLIKKEYGLKEDSRIGNNLPAVYRIRIEELADYYTPVFKEEIAEYVFKTIKSQKKIDGVLRASKVFKICITAEGPDLLVQIFAAEFKSKNF